MKYFITTLFIFFSITTNAQNIDKENFVHEIYKNFVDSSFPHYLLSEDAFRLNKSSIPSYNSNIPNKILEEMNVNFDADTTEQKWDCSKLTNSKKVSTDSIGLITGTTIKTFTSNSWNKKRKNKEIEKQLSLLSLKRSKMKEYEKRVYFFSRPIFDNKKEYALIYLGFGCGMTCGSGCDYIFKRINGKWELIGKGVCISA